VDLVVAGALVLASAVALAGAVALLIGVLRPGESPGSAVMVDPHVTRAMLQRAAAQLCHREARVRLAGVRLLARAADDSPDHRQACINVLAAYLRAEHDPARQPGGELPVRGAAIAALRSHLLDPDDATTWCGLDIDLSGATLDGAALVGIHVTGGATVRLTRARVGGTLDLTGVVVTGGALLMDRMQVTGRILLAGATVAGGEIVLDRADVDGGEISLEGARLLAGHVSLRHARIRGGRLGLAGLVLDGGHLSAHGAALESSDLDAAGLVTTAGAVYLTGLTLTGGSLSLRDAAFGRATVSLGLLTAVDSQVCFAGATGAGTGVSMDGICVTPPDSADWGPFDDPQARPGPGARPTGSAPEVDVRRPAGDEAAPVANLSGSAKPSR
jgi:uncharacterized protein YjbI with pentapeptide repeats